MSRAEQEVSPQEQIFLDLISTAEPTPENQYKALLMYAENAGFGRVELKFSARQAIFGNALAWLRSNGAIGPMNHTHEPFTTTVRFALLDRTFTREMQGPQHAKALAFLQAMHNSISPVPQH